MKQVRGKVYIDPYYDAYYKINDRVDENSLTVGRVTGQCGTVMRNIVGVTYPSALEKGKNDALEVRGSRKGSPELA